MGAVGKQASDKSFHALQDAGVASAIGRRLRLNMFWAGLGRCLSLVSVIVLHALLSHSLGPAVYGQYVYIESLVVLLSIPVMAGLPIIALRTVRTQLIANNQAGASVTVRVSLMVLMAAGLLSSAVIAFYASGPGKLACKGVLHDWLPWLLSWAVCLGLLRLVSELARGYDLLAMSYLVGGQNGGFGVNLLVLLVITVFGMVFQASLVSVLNLQLCVQAASAVPAVIAILLISRYPTQRGGGQELSAAAGRLILSSAPILLQTIVITGLPEIDIMLLGHYGIPDEDIGVYGAAKKIIFLTSVPLLLCNHAVQPLVAELHARKELAKLQVLLRGTATIAGLPGLLAIAVLQIAPATVMSLIYGPAFAGGADVLRIQSIGVAAFIMTGSCGLVLTMTGHERAGMLTSVILAALYLVVAPYLVLNYGIRGAAAGTACLQIFANVFTLFLVYYHHRIWTGVSVSRSLVQSYICDYILTGRSKKRSQ